MSHSTRQVADLPAVEAAQSQCEINSGNNVFSCFPTADTVIPQHEYAAFVWNSRLPQFAQTNLVNIYLFQQDSMAMVNSWTNVDNPTDRAGLITYQVNDSWWQGARGSQWNGKNISRPFYWVVTRNDVALDGNALPQSTFNAVQTTFADSVISSMSMTSSLAAASSASVASVSSISAAAHSSASGSAAGSAASSASSSGLAPGSKSASFPHWAIAVIVVLGFLALLTCGILVFLIMRRMRRNAIADSNRGSMGSASPMMANVQNDQTPHSPLLSPAAAVAASATAGAALADRGRSLSLHGAPLGASAEGHDGASTISRANSTGDSGPFSGADAAIMADAFRKALRKPDFAGQAVDEGSSPETDADVQEDALAASQPPRDVGAELAEEGRDIRSVSSSRGVHVETLSDDGDTVQDH
ncbi:hypothetical protein PLICRDRAFT_43242 [Plicaturopsis crispa FD-325 SS-3]|nr:hypothetical protein PLICRDRAFT_43242 [Plicaturopsis crispa FD-325 SS-3]